MSAYQWFQRNIAFSYLCSANRRLSTRRTGCRAYHQSSRVSHRSPWPEPDSASQTLAPAEFCHRLSELGLQNLTSNVYPTIKNNHWFQEVWTSLYQSSFVLSRQLSCLLLRRFWFYHCRNLDPSMPLMARLYQWASSLSVFPVLTLWGHIWHVFAWRCWRRWPLLWNILFGWCRFLCILSCGGQRSEL